MRLKHKDDIKAAVDMTPMIDCVFLLLVFFMVSTTFNKQEADISFSLPGASSPNRSTRPFPRAPTNPTPLRNWSRTTPGKSSGGFTGKESWTNGPSTWRSRKAARDP